MFTQTHKSINWSQINKVKWIRYIFIQLVGNFKQKYYILSNSKGLNLYSMSVRTQTFFLGGGWTLNRLLPSADSSSSLMKSLRGQSFVKCQLGWTTYEYWWILNLLYPVACFATRFLLLSGLGSAMRLKLLLNAHFAPERIMTFTAAVYRLRGSVPIWI